MRFYLQSDLCSEALGSMKINALGSSEDKELFFRPSDFRSFKNMSGSILLE